MRYQKEITIFNAQQFDSMKPGQWFKWHLGSRGQYLGTTSAGVDVVRHQADKFGKASDCTRNKLQRNHAKLHGAK